MDDGITETSPTMEDDLRPISTPYRVVKGHVLSIIASCGFVRPLAKESDVAVIDSLR